MKKLLALVLTGMLAFSLAACGNSTNQTAGGETQTASSNEGNTGQLTESGVEESNTEESAAGEASETETSVTETENSETETAEDQESTEETADTADGNVLIAYFSWSGNTGQLAQMIQSETDGDLFVIEPETPYTDDYNTLLDVAQQEQSDNARPALAAQVENWDDYDTVFVGYPNWWGDAPMIILSFLEQYDCTGKTIVPFCTSGGGGFGSSISSIESSAAGAIVAEGLHVNGSSVGNAGEDVAAWIAELGLE